MNIEQIKELHYITYIDTVTSILKDGILCHKLAEKLSHRDLSKTGVQERRAKIKIPNAKYLHEYANLYFDAHNPMLCRIQEHNIDICVLCVTPKILFISNVVISDCNAARDYARFYSSPEGLENLKYNHIYDRYWNHDDLFQKYLHKGIKCAEVLVPEKVEPNYILSAYVYNQEAYDKLTIIGFDRPIEIKSNLFF